MPRTRPRPEPTHSLTLSLVTTHCPECGHRLWADYAHRRTVTTLDAVTRLTLEVRRCPPARCSRFHVPFRPESEAHLALPHHEFGRDVLTLAGRLRHAEHRSVPEIRRDLTDRGGVVSERTVTNLLDRDDELQALSVADPTRLRPLLERQARVVLAIDGLQPDVGHEVLWVLRDCLSGTILLARSLLSAKAADLSVLLTEVSRALPVPVAGVVSDGQGSIRTAVARALPGVPHPWCHVHDLREAARPISEADRHAKKELQKRVRGVRPIERATEEGDDAEAEVVRGYCVAVRAARTDDGRPPLAAAGLKLHDRRAKVVASLDRVVSRTKALPSGLRRLAALRHRGLDETAALGPPVRVAFRGVRRVAHILTNRDRQPARQVRRRRTRVRSRIRREASRTPEASVRSQLRHFVKVTKSYGPGRFACDDSPEVPRTNNDREQLFGSHRYHERRSNGRRRASPGLVVRGSVRVVSGVATRIDPAAGLELPEHYLETWRRNRTDLESRREARRLPGRFRRDPEAFLNALERKCLQLGLPA